MTAEATPIYGLVKPVVGDSGWGTDLRSLIVQLDTKFAGNPGVSGIKIYFGNVTIALAAARSGFGSAQTVSFSSGSSYAVVCSCDPIDAGGLRAVVGTVQTKTATSFTPRAEVADGTAATGTVTYNWIAIGT